MACLISKNPQRSFTFTTYPITLKNITLAQMFVKKILYPTIIKYMRVNFCLTMKNAVISDKQVDYFQLVWSEDLTPVQLAGRFNKWLYDDEFIHKSIPDIDHIGYCMLSINPT
jgi:hypothetical protein